MSYHFKDPDPSTKRKRLLEGQFEVLPTVANGGVSKELQNVDGISGAAITDGSVQQRKKARAAANKKRKAALAEKEASADKATSDFYKEITKD